MLACNSDHVTPLLGLEFGGVVFILVLIPLFASCIGCVYGYRLLSRPSYFRVLIRHGRACHHASGTWGTHGGGSRGRVQSALEIRHARTYHCVPRPGPHPSDAVHPRLFRPSSSSESPPLPARPPARCEIPSWCRTPLSLSLSWPPIAFQYVGQSDAVLGVVVSK